MRIGWGRHVDGAEVLRGCSQGLRYREEEIADLYGIAGAMSLLV